MKTLVEWGPGRRLQTIGLVVVAMAISAVFAGTALADAPDPVDVNNKTSPPIKMAKMTSFVFHNDGTGDVTVTVEGGWTWPSHGSSCTDDRAGVGYAVDWNDPTQPGNPVKVITFSEGGTTITEDVRVGALAANSRNAADNVVHPTPGSNLAGTGMADIANPTLWSSWRGGCGSGDTDGNGTNDNSRGVGAGTANGVDQSKLPRGTWGPISHRYDKSSDITRICVITYDVHKGTTPDANGGVGIPGKASEVTAGGSSRNGDNGAEKNSGTPLGNACPAIPLPNPKIKVEKLPKNQTVPVLGIATFKIVVTNTGDVDLTDVEVTDAAAPNCDKVIPGVLAIGASTDYTCLSNAVPSAGLTNVAVACGTGDGVEVCDDDDATATTRTARVDIEDITSNQDLVPDDRAALTGAIDPQGSITFTLYKGDCATGTSLFSSNRSLANALLGTGNTAKLSVLLNTANGLGLNQSTAGVYSWKVAYSGDTNTDGTVRNAAFSECNETFTINNG